MRKIIKNEVKRKRKVANKKVAERGTGFWGLNPVVFVNYFRRASVSRVSENSSPTLSSSRPERSSGRLGRRLGRGMGRGISQDASVKSRGIVLPLYFGYGLKIALIKLKTNAQNLTSKIFKRRWQEAIAVFLLLTLAGSGFFFLDFSKTLGATNTWTQAGWDATASAGTYAYHTSGNSTGWTKYQAKDSNVDNSANTVKLSITTGSSVQTSDTHFNAGTHSQTKRNGTGTGANVTLAGSSITLSLFMTATGASATDEFGYSVASAGDVNNDGFTDVIAGARYNDAGGTNAGRVYIYFGSSSMDSTADVTLTGTYGAGSGDSLGHSVSSAGDVNNDGFADVIVGAPYGDCGVNNAGSAHIYYGGSSMDSTADVNLCAAGGGDGFGMSVSSAGDVNNDGFTDVIVGARLNDAGGTDAGRAYIYFGGSSMDSTADVTLTGAVAGDNFGTSVSSAGNVNNDSFADVIVGAPYNDSGGTNAGRSYIYFGGTSMDSTADVILTGAGGSNYFGWSVSSAGNVNNDSFADVIVGAPWAGVNYAGISYIYHGGSSMDSTADVTITGGAWEQYSSPSEKFVSSAGDINNDGFTDVIFGAFNGNKARVYYGGSSMDNTADFTLNGEASGDQFGISVSSAGNVDNDSYADVIVGANFNDSGGTDSGEAYVYRGADVYYTSGDFTSSAIDTGQNSDFTTLDFTITEPTNTDVQFRLRTASTEAGLSSATWYGPTGTGDYYTSTGTTINSTHDGARWIQYKAYFTTSDTASTATLSDITINYQYYPSSRTLTSSYYDSSSDANLLTQISWTGTETTNTEIRLQVQTYPDSSGAPNTGSGSGWCGPSNCAGSDYFDAGASGSGGFLNTVSTNQDGSNDRWIQYKITLTTSDGSNTATVTQVQLKYVVNNPPTVANVINDPSGGLDQDSDGIVRLKYDLSDDDNTTNEVYLFYDLGVTLNDEGGSLAASGETDVVVSSGTNFPSSGTIMVENEIITYASKSSNTLSTITRGEWPGTASWTTKTVAHNNGVTVWILATATTGTVSKTVSGTSQTFTATLTPTTDFPSFYSASVYIRVAANDGEGANMVGAATSAAFAMDTKVPALTTFTIDSTADSLSINVSDDSTIQDYRLSNNSDMSSDGSNNNNWRTFGTGATLSTTISSWTFTGAPSSETVYLQVRDIKSNTASFSAVAPATPQSFYFKDITNLPTEEYREFIGWQLYTSVANATFQNYQLYRSTDGTTYSLLTTITSASTNYYTDSNLVATNTYYYKLRITDTNSDVSNYTSVLSDKPDGQGGTDVTQPTISSVAISNVKATTATVSWTTNELANSTVEYGTTAGAYNLSTSDTAYVLSHQVFLTGLSQGTAYYLRVKSTDIVGNVVTDDNSGAGYTFTTNAGPKISSVAVTDVFDTSATVLWNTDKDSDSYATYATNAQLSGSSQVGSSALVGGSGPLYEHRVNLTGLTAGTLYYFKVKSTDSGGLVGEDTNAGNYYTFSTTTDIYPPVISNVAVPLLGADSAVVSWNTDEPATSQTKYGVSTGAYTHNTIPSTDYTILHFSVLSGLTAQTKYYFQVVSSDKKGNTATSSEGDLTTAAEGRVVITGGGGAIGVPQADYDALKGERDQIKTERDKLKTEIAEMIKKDTTPPKISDIEIYDVGAFEAYVSFKTDELTTGFVLFGKNTDYGRVSASPDFSEKHTIKLSGLEFGTTYHLQIKAQDKAANSTFSEDLTFATKYVTETLEELISIENAYLIQDKLDDLITSIIPSLAPPFIEKPQVTEITEETATIQWRTNIPAYSAVSYAKEQDFDPQKESPYTLDISKTEEKVKEHSIKLEGLNPGTTYHFMLKSFVLPEVVGKSKDFNFTTKSLPIIPRVIDIKKDSFRVIWQTDRKTTSIVDYKNLTTGEILQKTDDTPTANHFVVLENLIPDTRYEIKASGFDEKGNLVESGILWERTSKDITPPKISGVKIDSTFVPGRQDRIQTIVKWQTDESANSIVYYELGTGTSEELLNKVQIDTLTTDHVIILPMLKPGTIYRVKIVSFDEAGNKNETPIRTFITPQVTESVLDTIIRNFEDTFKVFKKIR